MAESTALVPTEVGFLELPDRTTVDPLKIAKLSFLAGFAGKTKEGYEYDLRCFFDWCEEHGLPPLEAKRGHIELYLRHMETETAWKSATRCKRYDTVRGFYRACDRDEALPGKDPCTWVIRAEDRQEGAAPHLPQHVGVRAVPSRSRGDGTTASRPRCAVRDQRAADRGGVQPRREQPVLPPRA